MNKKRGYSSHSASHKFAQNAFLNVAGFVVTCPILILLTPYMLKVLGDAKFGVWAIVGAVTSYAQLSDLGMTTSLVKFVAEHWVRRDTERISTIVSTAFFSFAVIGGMVVVCIIMFRNFIIVDLLDVPKDLQPEALFVLTGVVTIFYFNLLFSVYNSLLLGIQRMDVTNGIMVASKTFRALGMYIFLINGFGLKGLIVNSAILSFLTIGANVYWGKKLVGGLEVKPKCFSYSELKEIIKYSANILLARLSGLAQDPINKIIIASYVSLPFVAFYEVGGRVVSMVREVFQIALMPLLPVSSELISIQNEKELKRIYLALSRILYLFAVPVFLLVILLAEPLVLVWLGDGYNWTARILQYLLIGHLFSLLTTPQYIILQGIGKPHINSIAHAISAGINVVIAIVLVRYIGIHGVLIGVIFSMAISSLYIDFCFRRIVGINIILYVKNISKSSLAVAALLGLSLICIIKYIAVWNLLSLSLVVLAYFLLYLGINTFTKAINLNDRDLLKRRLRGTLRYFT